MAANRSSSTPQDRKKLLDRCVWHYLKINNHHIMAEDFRISSNLEETTENIPGDFCDKFWNSSCDKILEGLQQGSSRKSSQSRTLSTEETEHEERSLEDSEQVFSLKLLKCLTSSNRKTICCCSFSENGQFLVGGGEKKTIRRWYITKNFKFKDTKGEGHTGRVVDLKFKPKSTQFATSSVDRTIRLWDATGQWHTSLLTLQAVGNIRRTANSLDFHPWLDLLYSCYDDDNLFVWDLDSGCIRDKLKLQDAANKIIRFGEFENQTVLAVVTEGVVNLIPVDYRGFIGPITHTLTGHATQVHAICWNRRCTLVGGVSNRTAIIWSVSGFRVGSLTSTGGDFRACTFHPGFEDLLIIGDDKGNFEIWSPTDPTKRETITGQHNYEITCLSSSVENGTIVSASRDNKKAVKVWT